MYEVGAQFEEVILSATEASSLEVVEVLQELWSGYGRIVRMRLDGSSRDTVVVKHVKMPTAASHPRGWNSNRSHERKVRSYEVETAWYREWSGRCDARCRIPALLTEQREGDEVLIVLEDLDAAGFSARLQSVGWQEIELCLHWLAHFHATFLGEKPQGLWETGTYWHLATRPDELEALDDEALKEAAVSIDEVLSSARFQSFVHGDAKLANFCFKPRSDAVAAVDFQYVGGGCGMKDVAYFIGSCLNERSCAEEEERLLDCYFAELKSALGERREEIDEEAVEAEWRALFPVAWTDFHRFLKGWSPGHWKLNSYSERVARDVVAQFRAS